MTKSNSMTPMQMHDVFDMPDYEKVEQHQKLEKSFFNECDFVGVTSTGDFMRYFHPTKNKYFDVYMIGKDFHFDKWI